MVSTLDLLLTEIPCKPVQAWLKRCPVPQFWQQRTASRDYLLHDTNVTHPEGLVNETHLANQIQTPQKNLSFSTWIYTGVFGGGGRGKGRRERSSILKQTFETIFSLWTKHPAFPKTDWGIRRWKQLPWTNLWSSSPYFCSEDLCMLLLWKKPSN